LKISRYSWKIQYSSDQIRVVDLWSINIVLYSCYWAMFFSLNNFS